MFENMSNMFNISQTCLKGLFMPQLRFSRPDFYSFAINEYWTTNKMFRVSVKYVLLGHPMAWTGS